MATRSVIGYMQADGSFIGCYCHYDGYPSGVGSNLLKMNTEDIRTMVTAGIMKGGIRAINGPDLAEVEYFHEHWPEAKRTQLPGGEEYDYIMDIDGSLTCTDRQGNDIPRDQWHR
jgi:hypothetical protein